MWDAWDGRGNSKDHRWELGAQEPGKARLLREGRGQKQ